MRLFLFAFLLLTPGLCRAQVSTPPAAPTLTVDDAVRLAVQNNPRLRAAVRESGAARAGVSAARALSNPGVIVTPGLTNLSGSGDEFLVQQPLELNGTRAARTGVAQASSRATAAQAIVSLRDVVYAAQSAYFELARAREQTDVAKDALQAAQEFDRIARLQVEAGARPGLDLAQTGLEVSRAKRQWTLAQGEAQAATAALNAVLARAPDEPVGELTPLVASQSASVPDASFEDALTARAEVQVEDATRARFEQEAQLARAEGRPDLIPQFRIGSFSRGIQSGASGNGAGFGLGLTLPFLDFGGRRARIRQAEQAARAQQSRIEAVQNEIRQEVAQAQARLRASESVVRDYQSSVLTQADRLLEGSRVGFQEGKTTVVALLEAQRTRRQVQNEFVNALADAALARAALERAAGTISPLLLPADK